MKKYYLAGATILTAFVLTTSLPAYAGAAGGKSAKIDRLLQDAITETAEAPPPPPPPAVEPPPPPPPAEEIVMIEEEVVVEEVEPAPERSLGFVFGRMLILPSITLTPGYNDNLLASNTNEVDDYFLRVNPKIRAELIDGTNDFAIDLAYNGRFHKDEKDEDRNDYYAGLEGTVKGAALQVPYKAYYQLDHEERSEDLMRQLPDEPIEQIKFGGEAGIASLPDQGPLAYSLLGRVYQEKFENGTTSAGAPVIRSDADRETWEIEGSIGYAFLPHQTFSLGGLYGSREYEENTYEAATGANTGPTRDSQRYAGWLGWNVDYGDRLDGMVRLGYEHRDYDSNAIDDKGNVLAEAELNWYVTPQGVLKFDAHHGQFEDDEIIYPIVETELGLLGQYTVAEKVVLGLGGAYRLREFEQLPREDQSWILRAMADYNFSEHLAMGAEYNFVTRESDQSQYEYDNNIYMLRMTGRL